MSGSAERTLSPSNIFAPSGVMLCNWQITYVCSETSSIHHLGERESSKDKRETVDEEDKMNLFRDGKGLDFHSRWVSISGYRFVSDQRIFHFELVWKSSKEMFPLRPVKDEKIAGDRHLCALNRSRHSALIRPRPHSFSLVIGLELVPCTHTHWSWNPRL